MIRPIQQRTERIGTTTIAPYVIREGATLGQTWPLVVVLLVLTCAGRRPSDTVKRMTVELGLLGFAGRRPLTGLAPLAFAGRRPPAGAFAILALAENGVHVAPLGQGYVQGGPGGPGEPYGSATSGPF